MTTETNCPMAFYLLKIQNLEKIPKMEWLLSFSVTVKTFLGK